MLCSSVLFDVRCLMFVVCWCFFFSHALSLFVERCVMCVDSCLLCIVE